jgi:DNA-binding response OmpR family regulator
MADSEQKTVLVVDDDEHIRTIASRLMEAKGHRVITAENGRQAVEALQAGAGVELAIVDVKMPELDGFETLVKIREDLGLIDLPVIMLTGQTSDADVVRGYGVGADYYLTKPFDYARLVNVVDYLIGDLSREERAKLERLL